MLAKQIRCAGFGLIELMVSVSLIVILVMLAAPSLAAYTENSKVRAAAESFLAGAQAARAEAIRTNLPVQMVLTDDVSIAANKDTVSTNATSGNWLVRRLDTATGATTFVEGKSALEGSGASGMTSITVSATSSGAAQPTLTFGSGGNSGLGSNWQVDFASTTASCAHASVPGSVRCLRVIVRPSGIVKSCDLAAAAPDSRAC